LKFVLRTYTTWTKRGFIIGMAQKLKVVIKKRRRDPHYTQNGNREMVTVVECISADGRVTPPLYIYKGTSHTMGNHAAVKKIDETTFCLFSEGVELGMEWLKRNFEMFTKDMYISSIFRFQDHLRLPVYGHSTNVGFWIQCV
jgi:hypothetical protein